MRAQDTVFVVVSVAVSKNGRDLAWQFFKDHWQEFMDRYQVRMFDICFYLFLFLKVQSFNRLFSCFEFWTSGILALIGNEHVWRYMYVWLSEYMYDWHQPARVGPRWRHWRLTSAHILSALWQQQDCRDSASAPRATSACAPAWAVNFLQSWT